MFVEVSPYTPSAALNEQLPALVDRFIRVLSSDAGLCFVVAYCFPRMWIVKMCVWKRFRTSLSMGRSGMHGATEHVVLSFELS